MPQLFLLGLEVVLSVGLWLDFAGDTLDDGDACGFQGGDLVGIVGKQTHPVHAQRLQNSCGKLEAAVVGFEAKFFVGFHGIEALILQGISLQLGHEPNTPPLLLLIEQDARASLRDEAQRHLQLLAAIAAQRIEDIARQALRMNSNQRRSRVYITQDQGYSFFGTRRIFELADKAVDAKMRPARREISFSDAANDWRLGHSSIIAAPLRPRLRERFGVQRGTLVEFS